MELFPLSKSQNAVWNMEQYFGGSVANITASVFFTETGDNIEDGAQAGAGTVAGIEPEPKLIEAVKEALQNMIRQFDSLRIRIRLQQGTPMQTIDSFTPRDIETMRFSEKNEFEQWVGGLAKIPFDLGGDLNKVFVVSVGRHVGFVLHLHHLTADAWTVKVLTESVLDYLKGEKTVTCSYLDHIAKEQEYESSVRQEKDRDFFFSGFDQCVEPVCLADRQAKNAASNRLGVTVHEADTGEILSFCKDHGFSPYTVFMNALATYIYRIKGAQDFFVGTTVLNRTGSAEKSTAGMFVNTVPVLLHLDDSMSAVENLRQNALFLMGVFRHQKYPYGDLLRDLREMRGVKDRLFDVTLNFQNAATTDGIIVEWYFCGCQGESLNIHIYDRHCVGAFHIDYDYQTELFNEQEIMRLHGHLMNLIQDTIRNPGKKPQELKMLTAAEYQRVVVDFNDTAIEYPKEKCLHQLFEERAAGTPDRAAVIFEEVEYTYRQINEMADSLALILREKGIRRNDIVAIIAKRSYKIIVAQLAILKAGGAYMPIDPNCPKERVGFMLNDARCRIALVLGTAVSMTECIDMGDDSIFHHRVRNGFWDSSTAAEYNDSSEDLCYVIYTSGSTGTPKGAMISHRNFGNYLDDNRRNVHCAALKNCKSFLCLGAFSFDMASAEVYLAFINNRTLVLPSERQLEDPGEIARLIEKYTVDNIFSVPTRIMSYMSNKDFAKAMRHLQVFLVGGEALLPDIVRKFKENTKAVILNQYGPTETTIVCSASSIDGDTTIGRPVANTQIYILDRYNNPQPIGAVGELCISGDGVGLGYLNNQELTAKKFSDNPFIAGGRMYRSGDLGRFLEDGRIEYVGRMDQQVKIRGLRIELGEVETVLLGICEMRQIIAAVKKDENGRQYLCAYYTGDQQMDEDAVRTELAKKLPRYMIPHFFIHLDTFPVTVSGKTDHKLLPVPDFLNIRSRMEYAAPVTEDEKTVVAILQQVLDLQKVGVDDDFFDLGGDSLKVIEFVSKARYKGMSFSLQDVFDNPTAALLLRHLEDGNPQKSRNPGGGGGMAETGGDLRDGSGMPDIDGGCRSALYTADDFMDIDRLLGNNTEDGDAAVSKRSLGDVLITGTTGWLGAHVLNEFLSDGQGTAYCLVRGANLKDSRERLAAALESYFGAKYRDCDRIIVVRGDITGKIVINVPIDTIIHCAANVKHYGAYQQSETINVRGTENVIAFAKEKKAALFHISTASVSGNSFDTNPDFPPAVFDETKLYIGQPLNNVYIRSKFEAEAAVLRAKIDGLEAAVLRVGNLANRRTDYRFQRNYKTNATLTRLKAFIDLGLFPAQMVDFPLEFSPVDDSAKVIITLAQHYDSKHSVFHAYHHKAVRFGEFIGAAQTVGIKMKAVPNAEFIQSVRNAGSVPETAYIYEAFVADIEADEMVLMNNKIKLESHFTGWCLKRAGYVWPDIDEEYLRGYIDYFTNIRYWKPKK